MHAFSHIRGLNDWWLRVKLTRKTTCTYNGPLHQEPGTYHWSQFIGFCFSSQLSLYFWRFTRNNQPASATEKRDKRFMRGIEILFCFFFFFFLNIKTPAGVFYWKINSTYLQRQKKEEKETKSTLAIYKISGNYVQGFREFMQIKLNEAAICKIPGKVSAASGE